ncbi:MAG: type II CRISPR RNA-guided endonuclease Cas9 [Alphaproteobacteria bacterium]
MSAWRLGIDMGTNSIGIAGLKLTRHKDRYHPTEVLDMGVRIFSDGRNPKDGQSLAAKRRMPKGMRKTRDRKKNRDRRYLSELQQYGLLPTGDNRDHLEEDPYILRLRGLDECLQPHQLGRALWHLKRRGFKSNRKTDGGEEDGGKIRDAARRTAEKLAEEGCRTIGEWLGKPRLQQQLDNTSTAKGKRNPMPQARVRLRGAGSNAFYDFYPTRDMILDEFDKLWESQRRWHPDVLSDEAFNALRETLAWQWPLKTPPVGRCTLLPDERRAPRALPSVQRLRILQDLNHLTILLPGVPARPIDKAERDLLFEKALTQQKLTFDRIRTLLKLPSEARFNLESERRKHIDGDLTAAKLKSEKYWGPDWLKLPLTDQDSITTRLLEEENETALKTWLVSEWGLSAEDAESVSRAGLPAGHGAFCKSVVDRLLPALEANVVSFDKAVKAAGFDHHSDFRDGEVFPGGLPYYGRVLPQQVAFGTGDPNDPEETRYGKIANPTVHVALNQVRKVVNDLIKRHGTPAEIVVELARDLPLSAQGRRDNDRKQRENTQANEKRNALLAENNLPATYANRLRLRLWEELSDNVLDRRCVFTGEQISLKRLFSDEVEIEHLLPFSRTLDDGIGNKVVSMRDANRIKARQTPYEAFSHSPGKFDWESILARAALLPKNKSWRFAPDAMERYDNEERNFLARQLTDTQYIARIAKAYLEKTGAKVWVVPGRLTADLRWALGLDSVLPGHNREESGVIGKNRLDHRHHAVDALVVALTDRSMLQAVARSARRQEDQFSGRFFAELDDPWEGFREQVMASLDRLTISHKPDHGVQGALHNDTAYGLVDSEADPSTPMEVVHRVALSDMKKKSDIEKIRDPVLRELFLNAVENVPINTIDKALIDAGEAMTPPVRRVRICETLSVIPISNGGSKPFKAYKGDANYCYDISMGAKGKWTGRIVSRFDANQSAFEPESSTSIEGEKLLIRLRVNDMLQVDHDGSRQIMRVVKLSNGRITIAAHHEAGSLKARDADADDPFKYVTVSPAGLQTRNAKLVTVSPSGRVFIREPGG